MAQRVIQFIWACAVSLTLLVAFELSAKSKTIVTWTTEVWSKAAEEDGRGAYFDLLNAIYPPAGFQLVHRFLPYKRGIKYVKEGRMDIFSLCHAMPYFEKTGYPWAQESYGVLFHKKNSANWQGPSSLEKSTITVHSDASILPEFQDGKVKVLKTYDRARSLKLLEKHRVDYFLDVYINLKETVDNSPTVTMNDFQFEPLQVVTCYPGFTASSKGKMLRKVWDEGVQKLHESGQLHTIYSKWHLESPNIQWNKDNTSLPVVVN